MSKGKYAVYERINLATPEDNPLGEVVPTLGFHAFFFPTLASTPSKEDQNLGWHRTLESAKAAIATHRRRNIPVYEEEV